MSEDTKQEQCPMHQVRRIPNDGTPTCPSPTFAIWREEGAATPLEYSDGHEGLIINRYELAKMVLEDKRFSQTPARMPAHHGQALEAQYGLSSDSELDLGNVLGLDGEQHARIRRTILNRYSVRSARGYESDMKEIVAKQLKHLMSQPTPVDVTEHYSQPISAAGHMRVLGIPEQFRQEYSKLFVGDSTTEQKVEFLRRVLPVKKDELAEDVLSDLLRSDLLVPEIEGLTLSLMVSGRDSVAYMITTCMTALLNNPEQLKALRDDPTLIAGGMEEFMRVGAMFLTLFPRTATEDLTLGDVHIKAGQSVSVSPVAANHDERQFPDPDKFDLSRDAFGHIGFGHGIHGCVGQQVARVEIREGVMQLINGIPSLHLVHAEQNEPGPFAHPVATYEAGELMVSWN
ncbi:MAG: cytochrome P450 [Actinobacteria bacterium]|nr:cytochrome P450 [Actinomycetota bacterium]